MAPIIAMGRDFIEAAALQPNLISSRAPVTLSLTSYSHQRASGSRRRLLPSFWDFLITLSALHCHIIYATMLIRV
jgi:hypothetical protein